MAEDITIIGCGYVGLVTGACLSKLGHNVTCVDSDKMKVEKLNAGIMPFYEHGLMDIVVEGIRNNHLRFRATANQCYSRRSSFFFICVGTSNSAGGFDDSHVLSCVSELRDRGIFRNGSAVVIKSTVLPGTCRKVQESLSEDGPTVLSNPEFLAEGRAVKDFFHPDRTVIGHDNRSGAASRLEGRVYAQQCMTMSWESAELTKLASNMMLAARVSLINEVAGMCSAIGASIDDVARAVGRDRRIGMLYLNAGVGFGGSCLPKDTEVLVDFASSRCGVPVGMISQIMQTNSWAREWPQRCLEKEFGCVLYGKRIAVWGLSFKPETDDTRMSPGMQLVDWLVDRRAEVYVHDPMVCCSKSNVLQSNSCRASIQGADALVVMTGWKCYSEITDWAGIKEGMRGDLILDGRLVLWKSLIEQFGFRYHAPGRTNFLD